MKKRLISMLLAAAACGPAGAQTVYRCGDSYSHQPCAGATTLQADDARPDAQARQSVEATQRQAKLADAMEKARLKEEAKPVSAYIPAPPPTAKDDRRKFAMTQPGKTKYFTAIEPGEPGDAKKKKKQKKKVTA